MGRMRLSGVTRRAGILSFVVVLLSVAVMLMPGVRAAGPSVRSVVVSGPSPFSPGCEAAPQTGINFLNAEVEPRVAVDPTRPSHIVGVWQQDRWSNGGAHGLLAAASFDGGATWTRSMATFSRCSGGNAQKGGDYERATDPWVTFDPNGVVYQIALSFDDSTFRSAILVSKSADGGVTWGRPTALISTPATAATIFDDKESITADPRDPRFVYAVWDRLIFASEQASITAAFRTHAFRGPIMFSRTIDGGQSWEPARAIFDPGQQAQTISNQIVVLPNGDLVNLFTLIFADKNAGGVRGASVAVIRSTDKGATWSQPVIVSKLLTVGVTDPDTGQPVRTGDIIPDIAVDPTSGNLYAVWQDGRFSGFAHDDIAFSMSTDGGLTWSAPTRINKSPGGAAAFTATVRVAADGTVGTTYYDFRFNTPAPGLPTDYWLVHCHGGCTDPARWSETHIAGSFDMETAPFARGFFVGDYEGLTNIGNDFLAFFVQTNTGNLANRTDVVAARVGVG